MIVLIIFPQIYLYMGVGLIHRFTWAYSKEGDLKINVIA